MISSTEIIAKFAEIVALPASQVRPETELGSLPGWDSLAQISFVALLDAHGIKLPTGALQSSRTIGDLLQHARLG